MDQSSTIELVQTAASTVATCFSKLLVALDSLFEYLAIIFVFASKVILAIFQWALVLLSLLIKLSSVIAIAILTGFAFVMNLLVIIFNGVYIVARGVCYLLGAFLFWLASAIEAIVYSEWPFWTSVVWITFLSGYLIILHYHYPNALNIWRQKSVDVLVQVRATLRYIWSRTLALFNIMHQLHRGEGNNTHKPDVPPQRDEPPADRNPNETEARNQNTETHTTPDSNEIDAVLERMECIVCKESERCMLFQPCGHMSTCKDCAEMITMDCDSMCPLCRAYITRTIQVFW